MGGNREFGTPCWSRRDKKCKKEISETEIVYDRSEYQRKYDIVNQAAPDLLQGIPPERDTLERPWETPAGPAPVFTEYYLG